MKYIWHLYGISVSRNADAVPTKSIYRRACGIVSFRTSHFLLPWREKKGGFCDQTKPCWNCESKGLQKALIISQESWSFWLKENKELHKLGAAAALRPETSLALSVAYLCVFLEDLNTLTDQQTSSLLQNKSLQCNGAVKGGKNVAESGQTLPLFTARRVRSLY